MARVYLITGSLKLAYTVDFAVGTGCANKRDDALLVQFFLKVVSEGPQKDAFTPPGRPAIATDGIWGPNSQAYLDQFINANSAQNPSAPLKKDGRVDAVVGGKLKGSLTGLVYTILALNNSYRGVRGNAAMLDITTDALFPAELRPSLKIIQ